MFFATKSYLFFFCLTSSFVFYSCLFGSDQQTYKKLHTQEFNQTNNVTTSYSLDYLLLRSVNSNLVYAAQRIWVPTYGAYLNKVRNLTLIRPKRTWRPGLKFRFSVEADVMNQWSLDTGWMYYYNKSVVNHAVPDHTLNAITGGGQGLVSYFTAPVLGFNAASSNTLNNYNNMQGVWQLNYNMIDWVAKRAFSITSFFSAEPFFGLKNGWIYQKIAALFMRDFAAVGIGGPVLDSRVKMHNKFWGIGVTSGLNLNCILGKGFVIKSTLSGALLSGRTRVRQVTSINNSITTVGNPNQEFLRLDNQNFKVNQISPGLETNIGIEWGTSYSLNSKYFGIAIAWDSHYWWGQFSLSEELKSAHNITNVFDRTNTITYPTANKSLQIEGISVQGIFNF